MTDPMSTEPMVTKDLGIGERLAFGVDWLEDDPAVCRPWLQDGDTVAACEWECEDPLVHDEDEDETGETVTKLWLTWGPDAVAGTICKVRATMETAGGSVGRWSLMVRCVER